MINFKRGRFLNIHLSRESVQAPGATSSPQQKPNTSCFGRAWRSFSSKCTIHNLAKVTKLAGLAIATYLLYASKSTSCNTLVSTPYDWNIARHPLPNLSALNSSSIETFSSPLKPIPLWIASLPKVVKVLEKFKLDAQRVDLWQEQVKLKNASDPQYNQEFMDLAELIALLVYQDNSYKPLLSLKDKQQTKPLSWTAVEGRLDTLQALVDLDAHFDFSATSCVDHLATCGEHFGKSSTFDKFMRAKYLSHSWEIGGKTVIDNQEVQLAGFYTYMNAPYMVDTLQRFGELNPDILPVKQRQTIVEALIKVADPRQSAKLLLQDFKEGKPIIVSTGYMWHEITIVFQGATMLICNKGVGTRKPIEAYTINPTQLDEGVLHALMNLHDESERIDGFNNLVGHGSFLFRERKPGPLLVKLQADDTTPLCRRLEGLHHDSEIQEVGNCSWESLETAVYGIMALQHMEKTSAEGNRLAYEQFDHWQQFVKVDSLSNYIKEYESEAKGMEAQNWFSFRDFTTRVYRQAEKYAMHPEAKTQLAALKGRIIQLQIARDKK